MCSKSQKKVWLLKTTYLYKSTKIDFTEKHFLIISNFSDEKWMHIQNSNIIPLRNGSQESVQTWQNLWVLLYKKPSEKLVLNWIHHPNIFHVNGSLVATERGTGCSIWNLSWSQCCQLWIITCTSRIHQICTVCKIHTNISQKDIW